MPKKPTIAELTEALQRERADAENIRRRHTEEIMGLKTHVKANVVRELLPVIDNINRALAHAPKTRSSQLTADSSQLKTWEDWAKGVMSVKAQFEKVLSGMGVERIKTVGTAFDPHLHEAVSIEGDGGHEIVAEELQPGYKIANDVIRHATVRVKTEEVK